MTTAAPERVATEQDTVDLEHDISDERICDYEDCEKLATHIVVVTPCKHVSYPSCRTHADEIARAVRSEIRKGPQVCRICTADATGAHTRPI